MQNIEVLFAQLKEKICSKNIPTIEISRANLNFRGEMHIDNTSCRIIKKPRQVCGNSALNISFSI